ncbi:MAG: 5-methyltetrahydrofolate--homocysteine methyltransferase [Robiginitomaculum sp.]|nr:MAG: 5-methyltetrahydrofolate--homocysteine methyltransferase [Robiginitomaculum sp.]
MNHQQRLAAFEAKLQSGIGVIDGAMGTSIQLLKLQEEDFRGTRLVDWPSSIKGNNDLLNLTKPEAIRQIHQDFLAAGADLIETNTFNATSISQADYGLQELAPEIAAAGAKLAREVADQWEADHPDRPALVGGAMGPLSKTLSLSPRVEDPGFREVDFEQVRTAYFDQAKAMIENVDFLIIETVFDTLNAKAAIVAVQDVMTQTGMVRPVIISGTITDGSGRTLSGQTTEAFWISIAHAKPWAVGLNCALGAKEMRPHIADLSRIANCRIIAFPNAGLPNAFGEYDETPQTTSDHLSEWARGGLVNLVGGCCGTTDHHVAAIVSAVEGLVPRPIPKSNPALRLSGLEPFVLGA